MNYLCSLITRGKYDLLSHIDFILWRMEPSPLSSVWIHVMVSKQVTCCMYVIAMSWMIVFVALSRPAVLSHWAVTWFKIYCKGQFATDRKGGKREREGERGRKGWNAETEIPFSSPIPPSLFSYTVNTEDPACLSGSTAPLQRDGGGRKCSVVFTNPGCPVLQDAAAVRWDLRRGVWWFVTQQSAGFFISTWHNSKPIHF